MVVRALSDRARGKRSSPVKAIAAAAGVGMAAAGLTYKVLRG